MTNNKTLTKKAIAGYGLLYLTVMIVIWFVVGYFSKRKRKGALNVTSKPEVSSVAQSNFARNHEMYRPNREREQFPNPAVRQQPHYPPNQHTKPYETLRTYNSQPQAKLYDGKQFYPYVAQVASNNPISYPNTQERINNPNQEASSAFPSQQARSNYPNPQASLDYHNQQARSNYPNPQANSAFPSQQAGSNYPNPQASLDYHNQQAGSDNPDSQTSNDRAKSNYPNPQSPTAPDFINHPSLQSISNNQEPSIPQQNVKAVIKHDEFVRFDDMTDKEKKGMDKASVNGLSVRATQEMIDAIKTSLGISDAILSRVIVRIRKDYVSSKRDKTVRKSVVVVQGDFRRYARMVVTNVNGVPTLVIEDFSPYVKNDEKIHYDVVTMQLKRGMSGSKWKTFNVDTSFVGSERLSISKIDILLPGK